MNSAGQDWLDRLAASRLAEPARGASITLIAIMACFGTLILWASIARVDTISSGPGRVIPASKLQVVASLEGGTVREIAVRPGQRVKAGQLLVRLDPTQASSELGSTAADALSLDAREARLRAELGDGTPTALLNGEAAAIEARVRQARSAEIASSLQRALAAAEEARRGVAQAAEAISTKSHAVDAARQELELVAPLVQKGIEPQIELVRAKARLQQATGEQSQAREALAQARANLREAEAEVRGVRDRYRAKVSEELADTRAEAEVRRRTIPAYQARLERSLLVSPMNAVVHRVMVTTVGGVVRPGEPVVELVPENEPVLIEARLSPSDIAFVRIGQEASIRLSAYESTVYGSVKGRVVQISPDVVNDDGKGESYFTVQIELQRNHIVLDNGQQLPIMVGMHADVSILGDRRTIATYLLTPFSRVKEGAFREN